MARGHAVVAGVYDEREAQDLREAGMASLTPIVVDVTRPDHVEAMARHVGDRGDRLRGVVNSAGIVVAGPLEFLSDADLRQQLDVNVIGLMAVNRALLPMLRVAAGRIVNIGSVGGRLSVPFTGAYSASKFALRALSDALRMELRPSGVHVALVEPGPIATPIWSRSTDAAKQRLAAMPDSAKALYGAEIDRVFSMTRQTEARSIPVAHVVDVVIDALEAKRPRAQYLVGREAHAQAWLSRLPARVRDRVLLRAMGLSTRRPR